MSKKGIREVRCRQCIFKTRSGGEYPCNECTEIIPYTKKFTNHFVDENSVSSHEDIKIKDSDINHE